MGSTCNLVIPGNPLAGFNANVAVTGNQVTITGNDWHHVTRLNFDANSAGYSRDECRGWPPSHDRARAHGKSSLQVWRAAAPARQHRGRGRPSAHRSQPAQRHGHSSEVKGALVGLPEPGRFLYDPPAT